MRYGLQLPGRCLTPILATLLVSSALVPGSSAMQTGPHSDETESEQESEEAESKPGFWARFKDPQDGKFDVTATGEGGSGLLPLLIPFNEPAIGFGLVGAIAYLHPSKPDATPPKEGEPKNPPTTTFAGGLYSENGTWGAAVGHLGVWKEGSIRYRGVLGYASANLDFYGIGQDDDLNENPIPFNIEGALILQGAEVRIGKSRFFAGGKYVYAATDTTFESFPDLDEEGNTKNAGITATLKFDNRDTSFTPNKGTHAKLDLSYFADALGGDFDYPRYDIAAFHYQPIKERWVLGLRAEYHRAGSGGPFYALPWVKLRGVPAFRYLGNVVATVEAEPRYKINFRWSVLAFAGSGRAAASRERLSDAERAYNYGAGFRYMLSRKLGMGAGLDVAAGPEDTTVYIIFGSAWGM